MRFTTLILLTVVTSIAYADTTWVAGPNVSGVWDSTGSPYIVQQNISIHQDSALSIESNVRIFFEFQKRLFIHGSLSVIATAETPVIFTSDSLPLAFRWFGIQMMPTASNVVFANAIIEHVRSSSATDGAINVSANATFDHVTIRNNYAYGISADNGAQLEMFDCIIDKNGLESGGGCGGGLDLNDVEATLTRCRISSNQALDGGGICARGNCVLHLFDCVVENNLANIWGGGGFIDTDGEFVARDCIFRENQGITGPGLDIVLTPNVTIEGCLFDGNTERHGYTAQGGAINLSSSNGAIQRCTFVNNSANPGSAISANSSALIVNSCIFFNNFSSESFYCGGPTIPTQYCNFSHNMDGDYDGNIPADFEILSQVNSNGDSCDIYQNIFLAPLFVNSDSGDYHLSENSPCIDAGDPELDLDPDSTIADIGAYYYDQGISAIEPTRAPLPQSVILHPAYPNPFNPTTLISFELPVATNVKLSVYDLTGRTVAELMNGIQSAGSHSVEWNASTHSSGIYLVSLASSNEFSVQKLVFLK